MRIDVSGNESDPGSGGPIHSNTSELLVSPSGFQNFTTIKKTEVSDYPEFLKRVS
jgi:hypothetical protein